MEQRYIHRTRRSLVLFEALESRQLLSNAISVVDASALQYSATASTIIGNTLMPFNGTVSLSTDSAQVVLGQGSAKLTATVTAADGSPVTGGTITFVIGRPGTFYLAGKPVVGSTVPVIAGKAELDTDDFEVGDNAVRAQYLSGDSVPLFANSSSSIIQAVQPTWLHVEVGADRSPTTPPEIAVTLTRGDDTPLFGSGYKQPADWDGVATSVARVNLMPPLPPGNPGGSISGGCNTTKGGVIGYVAPTPDGYVTFSEGGQVLGKVQLDSTSRGRATFRPGNLPVGHHTITVSYDGDAYFLAQSTQTVEFDIVPTQVAVVVQPLTSQWHAGQIASLMIQVSTINPDRVAPSGRVGIFCDGQLLAKVPLGKTSTVQNINLPAGWHKLRAIYYGDANCLAARSPVVRQRVLPNPNPNPNPAVKPAHPIYEQFAQFLGRLSR